MALTKKQSEILAYLEENGTATCKDIMTYFELSESQAGRYFKFFRSIGLAHYYKNAETGKRKARIFKYGPGKDYTPPKPLSAEEKIIKRRKKFSVQQEKRKRERQKLAIEKEKLRAEEEQEAELREVSKRKAEALANAQMLLAKPNTPFGWLIERSA